MLVIDAHPRAGSYCAALAEAYAEGATSAGGRVELLRLRELSFDPSLREGYEGKQRLEPDLERAQEAIARAQHLAFVYPSWWATYPALLKGFLDRALTPGFAFRYRQGGQGWDKLLAGRSGRLVVTMDWPAWAYRWYQGAPGHKAMARGTLGFCGIGPVKLTELDQVRRSTAKQRAAWLEKVREEGRRDAARSVRYGGGKSPALGGGARGVPA